MGRLSQFAHVCKKRAGSLALYALALLALWLASGTRPGQSQNIGTVSLTSATSSFSVAATSAQVIIPVCSASVTTNCLQMLGQVGHIVKINGYLGTSCAVLLDGSNDGTHWTTLGAIPLGAGQGVAQTFANGYYQVLRLKVNPGGAFTCGAMTGTYSGFSTPLNLSPVIVQFNSLPQNPVNPWLAYQLTPYLVEGFQCTNPNASIAYLEISDSATAPTLATGNYVYEIGIPATSTFSYPGPPWLGQLILWAEAVTAPNGGTAVSTPLDCNFQLNNWGPYLPLNPSSL